MKKLGAQKGYRALYADAIPLTDRSKELEQDIRFFDGLNASAMLDVHLDPFNTTTSGSYSTLPLPDPDIGEKSFAVKVTATSPAGAETNYYVIGFVRSGIYEVFSMEATPATYPAFEQLAGRATEKTP